jgi:hypothetical protein
MSVFPRWVKEYSTAMDLDLVTRLVINPSDTATQLPASMRPLF